MLATSSSLTDKFTKDPIFPTLYAPIGQGFDEHDNFRDPFIFYDVVSVQYYLIVSARTSRGVIIYYASSDLLHWSYQGVFYDGGSRIFFMMETPDLFKIGDIYYLLFSDIDSKNVYYCKSLSLTGPWNSPTEDAVRFDGKGFYAAKVILDNYGDHYIFAWVNRLEGDTDDGIWKWGGNLVVHKLYQMDDTKDLAVTIPRTLQAYLEESTEPISEHSRWGIVINPLSDTSSYFLSSVLNGDIANVLFNPINSTRYKISTVVSFTRSIKDFGFMIGACDEYDHFFSLRFVPFQQRFSFDKTRRSSLINSTVASNDVPFTLVPNIDYRVEIVIENSVLVVYLDSRVALSDRIYRAAKTSWGIFVDNASATFKNLSVTKPIFP
jgi:beta-fructofuranosidase